MAMHSSMKEPAISSALLCLQGQDESKGNRLLKKEFCSLSTFYDLLQIRKNMPIAIDCTHERKSITVGACLAMLLVVYGCECLTTLSGYVCNIYWETGGRRERD